MTNVIYCEPYILKRKLCSVFIFYICDMHYSERIVLFMNSLIVFKLKKDGRTSRTGVRD